MGPPGAATFTLRASKSLPTSKFPICSSRDKATDKTHHKKAVYDLPSCEISISHCWKHLPTATWINLCCSALIQNDLESAKTFQQKKRLFCSVENMTNKETEHYLHKATSCFWVTVEFVSYLGCRPVWPVWTPPQRWACLVLCPGFSRFWTCPVFSSQHPA